MTIENYGLIVLATIGFIGYLLVVSENSQKNRKAIFNFFKFVICVGLFIVFIVYLINNL